MALEHRRRVGEKYRNSVAALDPVFRKHRCQSARACVKLCVVAPHRPVNDGGVMRKDGSRALEKAERRQRPIVGRIAVEIGIVGRFRHARPLKTTLRGGMAAINHFNPSGSAQHYWLMVSEAAGSLDVMTSGAMQV